VVGRSLWQQDGSCVGEGLVQWEMNNWCGACIMSLDMRELVVESIAFVCTCYMYHNYYPIAQ